MNALNVIAGQLVPSVTGVVLENINPANGHVTGTVERSDKSDVDAAVESAKEAQPAWAALSIEERAAVLHRIADGLEAEQEALARMETEDTGKPLTTSTSIDIPRAIRNFRFFAEYGPAQSLETYDMEEGWNYTHRKAVGIVGLVTPWNLPLYLLSWKVAPALLMGNAIVAKPSEFTPQTASALGRIALEAGLPAGLLNIVHGLGPEVGQAIVEHPEIPAISFTGGTVTGRHVAATAAPLFKKLSLELGGKNPTIIFDDVPLEEAVAGAMRAGFTNGGQICLCGSRILVHQNMYEPFRASMSEAVANLVPEDPMRKTSRMGPVIHTEHRAKILGYLQQAKEDGATLVGGNIPSMPIELDAGAWLQPTMITGLAQDHACIQEEIFGPVVTLQSFANEEEAIELANGVQYGLAATVWTGDETRARRVAEALDTGMVWINDWLVRDLRVPFGGMKQSGVGREGGMHSLNFFSEARNIYVSPKKN